MPLLANDKRNHKTTMAFPALCAKGSMVDDVGMLVFHLLFDSCYTIHWFGREKNIETDWVTLKIYQPKHAIPDCSICIDCKNLSDQTFMLCSEMKSCASTAMLPSITESKFLCISSRFWRDMKIMERWTELEDNNDT